MLKKMRWRFIGSAMAAITAVVIVLLFVLNIGNYRNITRQQDEALDRLLKIESMDAPFSGGTGAPPFDDWMQFSPEVQYSLRFFSVHCTPGGEIKNINQDYVASVSETDAERYAHAALSGGKRAAMKMATAILSIPARRRPSFSSLTPSASCKPSVRCFSLRWLSRVAVFFWYLHWSCCSRSAPSRRICAI